MTCHSSLLDFWRVEHVFNPSYRLRTAALMFWLQKLVEMFPGGAISASKTSKRS